MNKIIAALKEFTVDLIIWSLLLKKPWQEHSLSLALRRTGHLTFQQLWEWVGVISTSQIMKQDLEKWNSSPKVAQPVFELKSSHIDESARHRAAFLEKITRFYYFFSPLPFCPHAQRLKSGTRIDGCAGNSFLCYGKCIPSSSCPELYNG